MLRKKLHIAFMIGVTAFVLLGYNVNPVYYWGILPVGLLMASITSLGITCLSFNYFFSSITQPSHKEEKTVMLTFDDGPHRERTPQLLAVLRKHKIKATFFVIGKHAAQHPELIREIKKEQHALGIHSYWHSNWFPVKSPKAIKEELLKTEKLIEDICGVRTHLFRPPFGVASPFIAKALKSLAHYKTIGWNVRSYDTKLSVEKTLKRIKAKLKKQNIILLHDTTKDIDILTESLITYLKENEYNIVGIDKIENK